MPALLVQCPLDVEEQKELFDPSLEESGGDEMAQFVQHNQKREAQKELAGFDKNFHGLEAQSYAARVSEVIFNAFSTLCGHLAGAEEIDLSV
jgi:hypothetical protein